MKTLDEFNRERSADLYERVNLPIKNGISCPTCGEELVDSCPNTDLLTYPPKKNVSCPKCNFRGYRIA